MKTCKARRAWASKVTQRSLHLYMTASVEVIFSSADLSLTWVVTAGCSFAIYPTSCTVCVNGCVNESLCWVSGDAHHPQASFETEFPPYFLISSKHLWKILVRVFSQEVNRVTEKGFRERGGEREKEAQVGPFIDLSKMSWIKYVSMWTVLRDSVVLEGVVYVWSIGEHTGISSIKWKDSRLPVVPIHPKIQNCVLKPWLSRERSRQLCWADFQLFLALGFFENILEWRRKQQGKG